MGLALGASFVQGLLIVPPPISSPPSRVRSSRWGGYDTLNEETTLLIKTFATVMALAAVVGGVFGFLRVRSRKGFPASVVIASLLSMIVLGYLFSQSLGGCDQDLPAFSI